MFNKGTYNPQDFEEEIYKEWESKKYFHAEVDENKKPFCIIMPPPNVTSQAHIGHALDGTYQDILTRFKRMQGYSALWLPGADHAALATEHKLVEKLKNEGKTKEQIGRDAFDKEAWDWYNYYGNRIMTQFKKMGFSADWDRYRFTMDEKSTKAVLEAFIKLFNKGLIYRGTRQTHWCTHCKSVVSDDEVSYSDEKGAMWHIRYPFSDGSGYIIIATTRPETLFGDTAVAVNPKDKRYKKIVGKMLNLPLTNRQIPIIADSYVESDFGTGMVKITPAHDPNDYEVSKRHNLELISVINKDGKINELAGEKFEGLTLKEARVKVEEELRKQGLLEKVEPYNHSVGHCERCKTAIEPMITEQWFVKMSDLVKPAIKVVKDGELKIHPKRFEKNYFHWLENIQDWCISRQIWTGHRIPIYYCDNCKNVMADVKTPTKCSKCGHTHFTQDSDVLDTWFSSALWPFSTLGWPDNTKELEYFYPTTVLVTAYDILTQWATKMVYMGFECAGATPFKNCLIHGLVRDELGRKMSKSLGNGVDPLEVSQKFGADSLRIALIKDMALGIDSRFSMTKVDNARGFINKIWNASKFISLHGQDVKLLPIDKVKKDTKDKWILTKLSEVIQVVTNNLEKYDVGLALSNVYNFAWNEFCDWYIELSKPAIYKGGEDKQNTVSVLSYVFDKLLKLLHPFIPYVTEYIYKNLKTLDATESIMISEFPTAFSVASFKNEYQKQDQIIEAIKLIRNAKVESKIASNVKSDVYFAGIDGLGLSSSEIEKLACISLTKDSGEGKVIYTPIGEFVLLDEKKDKAELIKELEAEISKVKFEVERGEKMLSNPRFVEKAPATLVETEKEKLTNNQKTLQTLLSKLNSLN